MKYSTGKHEFLFERTTFSLLHNTNHINHTLLNTKFVMKCILGAMQQDPGDADSTED